MAVESASSVVQNRSVKNNKCAFLMRKILPLNANSGGV